MAFYPGFVFDHLLGFCIPSVYYTFVVIIRPLAASDRPCLVTFRG